MSALPPKILDFSFSSFSFALRSLGMSQDAQNFVSPELDRDLVGSRRGDAIFNIFSLV